MHEDRRDSPRVETSKAAFIIFRLERPVHCVVRNISETGAALDFQNTVGIPERFDLFIKPELDRRNCRVAWRTDNRMGVRFV